MLASFSFIVLLCVLLFFFAVRNVEAAAFKCYLRGRVNALHTMMPIRAGKM